MHKLSLYLILIFGAAGLFAQSPHRNSIGNRDCSSCHISSTWKVDKDKMQFKHEETSFVLSGQHSSVDCAACHKSLVFSEAQTDCFSCHKDIHQNTVGINCERCHTTNTWIVKNIIQIHQLGRFPLVGIHQSIDCQRCHQTYSNLNFQPINSTCFSCHSNNYYSTTAPNHVVAGYSTDCESCHSVSSPVWAAQNTSHDFFPLKGGHNINNCFACHKQNTFVGLSQDCASCHLSNYNNTSNPNHAALKMSTDCKSCHSINSFLQAAYNHTTTGFALTGKHFSISCNDCHKGNAVVTTTCVSCHQANYNSAPNHLAQSYPTDCTMCHSTTNWTQANFNHATTGFLLTGAHNAVTCNSCHTKGFGTISTTCVSCHQANFNSAVNPNHVSLALPTDCSTCHTTTAGWKPATFAIHNNYFVLTGAHTTITCNNCHTNGYSAIPSTCVSCHQANFNSAPNHVVQHYPTDCTMCHSTTNWTQSNFNHATTGFPLTGAHTTVTCNSCHTNGFGTIPSTCVSCHQANFNSALNHVAQSYPTDCTMCHSTTNWTQSNFNHATTGFPLTGVHTTVTCSSCHKNGFGAIPSTCVSCHQANFNSTTNPNHVSLALPTDCSTCHTTAAGWKPATFAIHNNYYVLAGAHIPLTCANCHNGIYSTNIPNTCYGCHKTNYDKTTNPPHASTGFGTDCQTCHTQSVWQPATFNHDQQFFPIYSGSHNGKWTTCAECHTSSTNYAVYSCMTGACHPQSSTNNQHSSVQGYSYVASQCLACHPRGTSGGFNHATSIFPLTGAHITVTCIQCHQNGYPNTPTTCVACHQTDFNNTNNPSHKSLALSTDCLTCHTTTAGWGNALLPNHGTYFQLTGAHLTVATCATCHNGNFTNTTPATCVGCHQTSFNTAVNPNHTLAGIPTTCETCHTSTAWIPSTFSHVNTGFALTGLHNTIQCSACHAGKVTGSSALCASCHQSVYNTALNHVAQSYPTTCELCHNTTDFKQATFNHANTTFPLTGAHTTITCTNCHKNGFGSIPITCVSCHQADYNNAANPNHSALSLSTTCQTCHTTNAGWAPATFSTHSTYYVLAGAHISLACSSCHTNNTYNGSTPKTCIGCHQTDYNATSNPNHVSAQFSTDCVSCHSQTVWTGATFNHDATFFPIYSGRHNGRWTLCTQCHQDPANYLTFTCMSSGCHAKASIDSHHSGVKNYVYAAANCYSCHPKGNAGISIIRPGNKID